MTTSRQLSEFVDALHHYVQEPGWFMMKPANPDYLKSKRITEFFKDHADDIKALGKQYLRTADAIKVDFDLQMKLIVVSDAWQNSVKKYIAELGQFAGDSRVLLGQGL